MYNICIPFSCFFSFLWSFLTFHFFFPFSQIPQIIQMILHNFSANSTIFKLRLYIRSTNIWKHYSLLRNITTHNWKQLNNGLCNFETERVKTTRENYWQKNLQEWDLPHDTSLVFFLILILIPLTCALWKACNSRDTKSSSDLICHPLRRTTLSPPSQTRRTRSFPSPKQTQRRLLLLLLLHLPSSDLLLYLRHRRLEETTEAWGGQRYRCWLLESFSELRLF